MSVDRLDLSDEATRKLLQEILGEPKFCDWRTDIYRRATQADIDALQQTQQTYERLKKLILKPD